MSNYEIHFWLEIQILLIKNEWNLPSLSLALFFFNHIGFRTMCIHFISSSLFYPLPKGKSLILMWCTCIRKKWGHLFQTLRLKYRSCCIKARSLIKYICTLIFDMQFDNIYQANCVLGYHSTEFMSSYRPVSDAWPAKVARENATWGQTVLSIV